MQRHREEKTDADLVDTLAHFFRRSFDIDAQFGQHVGRTALARYRTIAVFGYCQTRAAGDKGHRCRNIKRAQTVATSAASIDEVCTRSLNRRSLLAHALSATDDLVDGLALDAQRNEKSADLRVSGPTAHNLVHYRARFYAAQIRAGDQVLYGFLYHSLAPQIRRKLANSCLPSIVKMDSGWNCTPSTGQCRCLNPIIVPSSLSAETSTQSGKRSGSTVSE